MRTERQDEILDFLKTFERAHGLPPSIRDIQRELKLASHTTAVRCLRRLAQDGLIEQRVNGSWGVRTREVQTHLFALPIHGAIPAGLPSMQEQTSGQSVAIDAKFFGAVRRPERLWGLEVRGDSMIEAHIVDGDIAVLETRPAKSGDIVAALVDETTTTLKRLITLRGKPVLRAANPRFTDLVPTTSLEIQGVLVGVIRRHSA